MYLLILIIPFTGALLATIFGRKFGYKGSSLICTTF